jgi:hypothetical protein
MANSQPSKPRALSGNSALKKTIAELEGLVIQRRQELDTLSAERSRLHTRSSVVRILDRHAKALLELGSLLRGDGDGYSAGEASSDFADLGGAAAAGPGGVGGSGEGAAAAPDAPQPLATWLRAQDVRQFSCGLRGISNPDDMPQSSDSDRTGSGTSTSTSNAQNGGGPQEPPLGWAPASAAQRAAASDLTLQGLRQRLKLFVLTSAPLLM